MRVAVVGAGPAGAYAAGHLLRHAGVEVELFDRLPTPWGLVRAGVAPDHQSTKAVTRTFEWTARDPRCRLHLNVTVGEHVSHEELAAHHHAVLYATGGSGSRELEGVASEGAAEFVAWYNGHPDHAARTFDLSGPRVVVIGNGNVALDVARVLTLGEDALRRTDIADHALAAIAAGGVEEVVVCGRRGPAFAAFTSPELLALAEREDIDVLVEAADFTVPDDAPFGVRLKLQLLRELADRRPRGAARRIVLRFDTPADAIPDAGLVLRSIGYNVERVSEAPGVYATGWVRRGPTGVIGTNKHDAGEVVARILTDDLPPLQADGAALDALLAERRPERVDLAGWTRIDAHERAAGLSAGRPRVKLTDTDTMVEIARTA